ncbi:MAG: hypothetical protein ABIY70_11680 [Capsulimonas sp.]|uniref:hypothetical protein n=1 Tax=Capsulimonas sp. TaxID=2494211 RepID=UPI003267F251
MPIRQALISTITAAVLSLSALPLSAYPALSLSAAPGSFGRDHGVYVGEGKILDLESTRQLTLREGVWTLQFSPSGEKIAFVTSLEDHGEKFLAIKIVDTWRHEPEIQTLVKQPWQTGAGESQKTFELEILGWAGDDRYVLFHRLTYSAQSGQQISSSIERVDLSSGSREPQPILTDPNESEPGEVSWDYAWSPSHDRLLIGKKLSPSNDGGSSHYVRYFLCDPAAAQARTLKVDPVDTVLGWMDDARLTIARGMNTETPAFQSYDLATGVASASTRPSWMGMMSDPELSASHHWAPKKTDPKDPALQLDIVTHHLASSRGDDTAEASMIWIRRTTAGKKFSAFPVGVVPGNDFPEASWSPTGKAVAFVAHGDIFLANLAKRSATALEKQSVGEKMSCEEEKHLAASNLKQIALGILQYAQDNDEHFPAAANLEKTIYPYLKTISLFTLDGSRFVYHAPADLAMASMDEPAQTVLGEMELPCAHIVLYADGHVMIVDK